MFLALGFQVLIFKYQEKKKLPGTRNIKLTNLYSNKHKKRGAIFGELNFPKRKLLELNFTVALFKDCVTICQLIIISITNSFKR